MKNYNNYYQDFLTRIYTSKLNKKGIINKELSEVLSMKSLDKIYDYFTLDIMNSAQGEILQAIASLNPEDAYRIPKEISGLPRTLNILRTKVGEYQLIVETNNRLADDTKIKLNNPHGALKEGRDCWRCDKIPVTKYFNLVSEIIKKNDYGRVLHEFNISKFVASRQTNTYQLGTPYFSKNKKEYVVSLYGPKTITDLHMLLTFCEEIPLSETQGNSLILDLLLGVQIFHDKNVIHQDLKPNNLLIDYDKKVGYRLKLTDFGFSDLENKFSFAPQSTSAYTPPELYDLYSDPNYHNGFYNYFFNEKLPNTLGKSLFIKKSCPLKQNKKYDRSKKEKYNKPHPANDIWAIGIIIFEIKYGRKPTLDDMFIIDQDPLLKGLLEPSREKRISIGTALTIFIEQASINTINILLKKLSINNAEMIDEKETDEAEENPENLFEKIHPKILTLYVNNNLKKHKQDNNIIEENTLLHRETYSCTPNYNDVENNNSFETLRNSI